MTKKIVIAIDGPAGAGKSTVARRIAEKLGFLYIDTGAMYRAVALWASRCGVDVTDIQKLEQLALAAQIELKPGERTVLLNGEDVTEAIRTPEISEGASKVSTVPGVRRALVEKQRAMGAAGSVVMEGRDIGSVVFPEADVKVFLDAESAVRAQRRLRELEQKGAAATAEQVEGELHERDHRDRNRAEAPLLQAPDASYVDSTHLSIDQVEQTILKIVRDRTSNGREFQR